MYYVNYSKSKKSDDHYIGCTSDLKYRFKQHNNGLNFSTQNNRAWELVYYEAYISKSDAFRREKMLKYDGRAKAMLKKRLIYSLEEGAA